MKETEVKHCHADTTECTKLKHKPEPVLVNIFNETNIQADNDEAINTTTVPGSLTTPLLLLAALCVHGGLEGIVLGLQPDQGSTISLLIAILIHKPVETLTLGAIMVREKVAGIRYFLLTLVLSLITPVGVVIGLGVKNFEIPPLLVGSLTALAIGSFIYISTTEIIADEFHSHAHTPTEKWKRYGSLLLGVTVILLIEIAFVGEHSHNH